jgi:hypothetical protein
MRSLFKNDIPASIAVFNTENLSFSRGMASLFDFSGCFLLDADGEYSNERAVLNDSRLLASDYKKSFQLLIHETK